MENKTEMRVPTMVRMCKAKLKRKSCQKEKRLVTISEGREKKEKAEI